MEDFLSSLFKDISLQELILLIVAGFIFTGVFKFVTENKRISTSAQSIILDVIVGFVLKNCYDLTPFTTPDRALGVLIFLIICVILGYILGLIYLSKVFQFLLNKLGIRRSLQTGLWSNITNHEKSLWVRIGYKQLDLKYYGIVQYFDETEKQPQIVLYGYTKGKYFQDLDTEFMEDHTGDMSKFVLLNTEKADFVEFVSTNEIRRKNN